MRVFRGLQDRSAIQWMRTGYRVEPGMTTWGFIADVGFVIAGVGFVIAGVGFVIAGVGFVIADVGFVIADVGFVIAGHDPQSSGGVALDPI